jgi:pyridoxal phosphate enzyme (YggS family)
MDVALKLLQVRARVAEAAERSGRTADAVRVVGVSKGSTAERVADAVRAGLREVGENRVQEAAEKIPRVAALVESPPTWHLVGHLQTNKARAALGLFDTIESVDSIRVAQTLSRLVERRLPVFLEVQFAHTPDRFGFVPDTVLEAVDSARQLPHLDVVGLMTVAPLGLDAEGTRRIFRALRERRDAIQQALPELPPLQLSMGMTDDYVIAIEEGSTLVRIGRAIFAD